jgi:hypothetical protein
MPSTSDNARVDNLLVAQTAAEVNESIVRLLDRVELGGTGECVWTGIDSFDKRNAPMGRGSATLIVGETNSGKSPLAATIMANVATSIRKRNLPSKILCFLTEELTEQKAMALWGDPAINFRSIWTGTASRDRVMAHIAVSNESPIVLVGDSADMARANLDDDTLGAMTPRRIALTTHHLINHCGIIPELVVVDHVHDLLLENAPRDEGERYDVISQQLIAYTVAMRPYCPVIFVGQAKKELATRPPELRMPDSNDFKYCPALISKARDIYGITYPKKYARAIRPRVKGERPVVVADNGEFEPSTGLFLVGSAKARYGEAGRVTAMTALNDEGNWRGLLTELSYR